MIVSPPYEGLCTPVTRDDLRTRRSVHRNWTGGVSTTGVTANFMLFDRDHLRTAINLLLSAGPICVDPIRPQPRPSLSVSPGHCPDHLMWLFSRAKWGPQRVALSCKFIWYRPNPIREKEPPCTENTVILFKQQWLCSPCLGTCAVHVTYLFPQTCSDVQLYIHTCLLR